MLSFEILEWKQSIITCRWIKYEQTIEGDGTRFSKPHITLLSVIGLIQLKNCFRKGVIILNAEAYSFNEIAGINYLSLFFVFFVF